MVKKLKLVISDTHFGRGKYLPDGSFNYLEDFFFDEKLIEFLTFYRTGEYENCDVELICNGDFFNHLQVDILDPAPDVIDEQAALNRTEEILKGHPEVFQEMRRFAKAPGHAITFILGNHDPGLLFPSVHKQLRDALGDRVQVKIDPYRFDGVHIEHGNQYFADNAYNTDRYFLTKGLPGPIVNLPWGSYFVIHYLNKVKKERPYFDKIYPFKYYLRWALIHDTFFALKSIGRILFYFFWLRFRRDPSRRSSFIRTLQIIKEVPLSPRLNVVAKKILLSQRDTRVVIFGHTHYPNITEFLPGKVYVNSGLWNEQVSLEISNPGRVVRHTYALLEYDEQGRVHASLKEWKGKHKIIEDVL